MAYKNQQPSRLPFLWWLPIGKVPEISAGDLQQWLQQGRRVQLIDARTALEYQQGTIQGARFAPLTQMPGSVSGLPLNPDLPVVALCLSGHRSLPAVRWLRSRGIEAYSLAGGVTAWKAAGYSLQAPPDA
jgi:rhodanese-related sulfurtransferase